MNNFTKEQLLLQFPKASEKEIKQAIKYQEKFSLTLENLKCLNSDCNNIRKWNRGRILFNYCCSNKLCNEKTKKQRDKLGAKKGSETYESRTGFKKPGQNPIVQKKIKETCLKKYGFESPLHESKNRNKKFIQQSHITNFENWNNKQFWIDNFLTKDNNFDVIKCQSYFNCGQVSAHRHLNELQIKYTKFKGTSLKEQALIPILNSLGITNIITNTKDIIKPLELDIYLPNHNLAIEYNGAFWHQESRKPVDYHQSKSIACLSKGIRLLHIFEGYNDYNLEETINEFLNYKPELLLKQAKSDELEFDLASGCYPLGLECKLIEPELINIMGFDIYDAGKIKYNNN